MSETQWHEVMLAGFDAGVGVIPGAEAGADDEPEEQPDPLGQRLAELQARWDQMPQGDPPGANEHEIAELGEARTTITGLLTSAPTEQILGQLPVLMDDYVATRQSAIAGAKARDDRRNLVARLPPEVTLDGAGAEQLQRVKAMRERVTGLPETPTAEQLADGEKALTDLPGLIQAIKQEITERRTKARAGLIARCPKEESIDGADAGQLGRIKAQREKITGLPDAPTEAELEQGEKVLTDLPGLIQTIKQEVTERRAKARAELIARCPTEEPIDGADVGQLGRIKAQREKITGLSEAPTEAELEQGEKALAELPGLIQAIKQEIAERRKKARAELIARCPTEEPIDGADVGQLGRIKAQREKITGLSEAPTEAELEQGEKALAELPGLIQAIKQEIAERRTAARAELVLELSKEAIPPAADTDQLDRIKKLTDRINGLPAEPDDSKLDDGRKAVEELRLLIPVIAKEIAAKERGKLVAQCVAFPDPAKANADQIKRIGAERQKIKTLPAVPSEPELQKAAAALVDLGKVIDEVKKEIAARSGAEEALARAQEALRAAKDNCTSAVMMVLTPKLTAPASFATAKTVSEFQKVKADADGFALVAQAAKTYGIERAKLATGRSIFDTASGLADTDPTNPLTQALAMAAGQANGGDFAAANTTLTTFKGAGPAAKIVEVFGALQTFRNSPSWRAMSRIAAVNPPGFNRQSLENELALARDPVVTANPQPADVLAAKNRITTLTAKVDEFAEYQARMDELSRLTGSAEYLAMSGVTPTPVWTTRIAAKKAAATTATTPIATAILRLNEALALFPADVKPYLAAQNKIAPSLAAIGADTGIVGTAFATKEFADTVTKEATAGNYANATAAIGVLEPKLTAILDFRAAAALFKQSAASLDPTLVAELRAEADKAVATNDFTDALVKITAATATLGKWVAYQARRTQVDELVKSASTAQQGEIDPFVKRTDALVSAKDPDGALAALNELRQVDAVSALDAEVADALKRLAAAEDSKQQAVKLLAVLSVPLDPLVKAADDALNTNHNPGDAQAKLATAEAQLKLAIEYARLHEARAAALKALPPPPVAKPAELTDAEMLASGANFTGAIAKLKTLATNLEAQCAAKAQTLETADSGHSRAAHGFVVTNNNPGCHENRIRTGTRPDGVTMPTQTATSWGSDEAFLSARQLAADELQAKYGIDITGTVHTIGTDPVTELRVIIENGRPIGNCAAGFCPKYVRKQTGPQKHEAVADNKYEEAENWTGLTRTRSVFKWKAPPGKWVLHQHFPEADDWDNVNQCYTAPVPEPSLK